MNVDGTSTYRTSQPTFYAPIDFKERPLAHSMSFPWLPNQKLLDRSFHPAARAFPKKSRLPLFLFAKVEIGLENPEKLSKKWQSASVISFCLTHSQRCLDLLGAPHPLLSPRGGLRQRIDRKGNPCEAPTPSSNLKEYGVSGNPISCV